MARLLGKSPGDVKQLANSGQLQSILRGGELVVEKWAIDKLAEKAAQDEQLKKIRRDEKK